MKKISLLKIATLALVSITAQAGPNYAQLKDLVNDLLEVKGAAGAAFIAQSALFDGNDQPIPPQDTGGSIREFENRQQVMRDFMEVLKMSQSKIKDPALRDALGKMMGDLDNRVLWDDLRGNQDDFNRAAWDMRMAAKDIFDGLQANVDEMTAVYEQTKANAIQTLVSIGADQLHEDLVREFNEYDLQIQELERRKAEAIAAIEQANGIEGRIATLQRQESDLQEQVRQAQARAGQVTRIADMVLDQFKQMNAKNGVSVVVSGGASMENRARDQVRTAVEGLMKIQIQQNTVLSESTAGKTPSVALDVKIVSAQKEESGGIFNKTATYTIQAVVTGSVETPFFKGQTNGVTVSFDTDQDGQIKDVEGLRAQLTSVSLEVNQITTEAMSAEASGDIKTTLAGMIEKACEQVFN